MDELRETARSYLAAGGYRLIREEPGYFEMLREDGTRDLLKLWINDAPQPASSDLTPDERTQRTQRETDLLARFASELAPATPCSAYYLVASRLGLSSHFIVEATRILDRHGDGGIREPVQFFDTPYRNEQTKKDGPEEAKDRRRRSRGARTVLDQVLALAKQQKRVAQPFFMRTGLGPHDTQPGSGDLVEYLDAALRDTGGGAYLHLIDGNAGVGKSVAFAALAGALYEEFKEAKSRRIVRRRPIVFLPDHIRGKSIGYVDDIIDAVAEAEIAGVVEPEQFHWLLRNGLSLWMFDGLDEFYGGDTDFFQSIEKLLTAPGSKAQILICSRDSLMSSSPRMRAFIEQRLRRGQGTAIYELAPWDREAWQTIAWLELDQSRGSAAQSAKATAFADALAASPELSQLASLPFYCALLLEQFRAKGQMPANRLELFDYIANRMIDREHGKGVFGWQDFFDVEALNEAIEASAEEDAGKGLGLPLFDGTQIRATLEALFDEQGRRNLLEIIGFLGHQMTRLDHSRGQAPALDVATMREVFAQPYLAGVGNDEATERVLVAVVQFAFFSAGRRAGEVDFTHPILAEYLAGVYAVGHLELEAAGHAEGRSSHNRLRGAFRQAIGTAPLPPGSIFEAVLHRAASENPILSDMLTAIASTGGFDSETLDGALARLLAVKPT